MLRIRQPSRREFFARAAAVGAAGLAAPQWLAAAADAPKPWQIGCYTRPWAAYDLGTALDAIAEAGFKHAGLMTTNTKPSTVIHAGTTLDEAQRIGREASRRGLEIPSAYADFSVGKSLAEGIAGLRHLIDLCAAAGAKSLLLGGTGSADLYPRYYRAIAECCPYAAEKHVALTIKPHGGLNATGGQLRKTIRLVGKPNFSVFYDAGNILFYSQGTLNPVEDAATVDGLVSGWCIKDYRQSPPSAGSQNPGGTVELTPGTGQVDFPAVFARLRKGGFTAGPLVVETLAPGTLPQLLAEAKKARKFLEDLVGTES
ncbi:MAG: sugar phosphate isomerase/epimerase family protein [Thermoguttaceae bacterium]|jgi:sugar phosphate isomerase/epimerase